MDINVDIRELIYSPTKLLKLKSHGGCSVCYIYSVISRWLP